MSYLRNLVRGFVDGLLCFGPRALALVVLAGCAWFAQNGKALEAAADAACTTLAPLAGVSAGVTALGCGVADGLFAASVAAAQASVPKPAKPSGKLRAVRAPSGQVLGHVDEHLAPACEQYVARALTAAPDAGPPLRGLDCTLPQAMCVDAGPPDASKDGAP